MQIDEKTLHDILNEVDLNKNGQVELIEFLQVRISLLQRNCKCCSCRHRCSVPLLLPQKSCAGEEVGAVGYHSPGDAVCQSTAQNDAHSWF